MEPGSLLDFINRNPLRSMYTVLPGKLLPRVTENINSDVDSKYRRWENSEHKSAVVIRRHLECGTSYEAWPLRD